MDPWSKGYYSWHIREALMVVEKLSEVNPPSDRVPRQVRRGCPDLGIVAAVEQRKISRKGSVSRVSGTGCKYRPKGAPGVPPPPQAPCWRDQEEAVPARRLGGA